MKKVCAIGKQLLILATNASLYVGMVLTAAVFVMTLWEVFVRYIAKPTHWALEYSEFAVMITCVLLLGYCLYNDHHVKIDLFTARMSAKNQAVLYIFTSTLSLFFCCALLWGAIQAAIFSYTRGEVSMLVTKTPLFPMHLLFMIGVLFLMIHFIISIAERIGLLIKK